MPQEKFGMLRGLSDIHIAKVTEDSDDNFTTETPEQLIPVGEMTVTVANDKQPFYFDNTLFDEIGKEGASTMTLTGAALRAAFLARLNGKEVDSTSGVVMDDGTYHQNFYSISGKKDYSDGTSEYFNFLKCSISIPDESSKTVGDDVDASGTTLNINAYKTKHKFTRTGKVCKVVRLDTTAGNTTDITNWFTESMTPDTITGTIPVTPVTPDTPDTP